MIWKRWLTAVLGVPALLILCWLGPKVFALTITLVAVVGLGELLAAYRKAGFGPSVLVAVSGLLGPMLPLLFPHGVRASAISLSGLASVALALFLSGLIHEVTVAHRDQKVTTGANVGLGMLCGGYIALFGGISMLRVPRNLDAVLPVANADAGFFLVLLVLCCVWATDTAAYYVGNSVGSVKLAPALSPHKTVEGAVGGFAAAVILGAILGHLLLGRALLGWGIGAAAGIAGQLGDLFESALKRELGIKDFGSIVPGHGGILDRFDSLLFTAPAVWILVLALG